MVTFTLVVYLTFAGAYGHTNLNAYTIPGYTTAEACEASGKFIRENSVLIPGTTRSMVGKTFCVRVS